MPRGAPTPEGLAQVVAAVMPEGAIVSDESVSFGRNFYRGTHAAAPHDWLHLAGGAIGDGLPVATGAAIAAKGGRRVVSLQADGSAMYSLQALWTQARERLHAYPRRAGLTTRCTSAPLPLPRPEKHGRRAGVLTLPEARLTVLFSWSAEYRT